jgi:hypothetical protein
MSALAGALAKPHSRPHYPKQTQPNTQLHDRICIIAFVAGGWVVVGVPEEHVCKLAWIRPAYANGVCIPRVMRSIGRPVEACLAARADGHGYRPSGSDTDEVPETTHVGRLAVSVQHFQAVHDEDVLIQAPRQSASRRFRKVDLHSEGVGTCSRSCWSVQRRYRCVSIHEPDLRC